MPPLPSHIGRYRVERELGRGAMGVIYQAEDPEIGRTVAIKLVRADLLEGEDRAEFLERFRNEARAAGRCAHPNIVAVFDFALHDGNPFLAMEFVDGIPLGQALKQVGRYSPMAAVAIVAQVLDALGAAHELGIVHRDIKPANILVRPDGQIKVTDFGISRFNTSEFTQQGTIIGTPAYMSPEQCRGENVDARGDLFSAGSVLYELLSGTRAFAGRNVTEVTMQLLTTEPRDLMEFVPAIPAALAGVLRRAMAKDRDARFGSAQAMADALRAALRDEADGAAGDRTVVLPVRPASDPVAGASFDEATLETIERRLARHVGPIARRLVRGAARQAASIEALCEAVSKSIVPVTEREQFLSKSLGLATQRTTVSARRPSAQEATAPSVSGPSVISAEAMQRVERALARTLGPIAKVLVKRAAAGAASEDALWERLATHIEQTADREAFLRHRSGG